VKVSMLLVWASGNMAPEGTYLCDIMQLVLGSLVSLPGSLYAIFKALCSHSCYLDCWHLCLTKLSVDKACNSNLHGQSGAMDSLQLQRGSSRSKLTTLVLAWQMQLQTAQEQQALAPAH